MKKDIQETPGTANRNRIETEQLQMDRHWKFCTEQSQMEGFCQWPRHLWELKTKEEEEEEKSLIKLFIISTT